LKSDGHRKRKAGHFDAVRFYEDRQSLARMVAGFLAEGVNANDSSVIIATPEHRRAILDSLARLSIDVGQLSERGAWMTLDAQELLATFMVDGMPSTKLFEEAVLPVIDRLRATRKNSTVRAYGEMVDVLWQDGQEAAAVRLEMLWNRLANTRRFSLLCGYSMGSFFKDAALKRICREHTHVIEADGTAAPLDGPRIS